MGDFVAFRSYSSTVEAEMHAEILRDAGIAVLIQSPDIGIFGAGASGNFVHGVTLMVSEGDFEQAAELIDPMDDE